MLPHGDAPPIGGTSSFHRHRILIADDNQESARCLARVMEMAGHETAVVANGREAIEAAATFAPTAVILDIAMPHVGGLAAAARLRATGGKLPMLLVALSGFDSGADQARSLAAGFDVHLGKPLQLDRIDALLARAPGIAER